MGTEATIDEALFDLFCDLVYGPALDEWTLGMMVSSENSIEVW